MANKRRRAEARLGVAGARRAGSGPILESDPHHTRLEGDRLYELGEFDKAHAIFVGLIEDAHAINWCWFQLGRIAARLGRCADAVGAFDIALTCEDPIVWTHFEKALALKGLGADPKAIFSELANFARRVPDDLNDGHFAVLLEGAHNAFDAGLNGEAETLYGFLAERGQGGYICKLRSADLLLRGGKAREALRILDEVGFDPELNAWAGSVRAAALLSLGALRPAVAILKQLVADSPTNEVFVRQLFTALVRQGDKLELRDGGKYLRHLKRHQRYEFLILLAMAGDDYDEAAELYAKSARSGDAYIAGPICTAIDTLQTARDFPALDRFLERIRAVPLRSIPLASSMLAAFIRLGQWEKAQLTLQDCAALGDPEIRMKRFELCCHTMQFAEATQCLAEWGGYREVPSQCVAMAFYLFAALGQWNTSLDFFRERVITQGLQVWSDSSLEVVSRALRVTARYGEVLPLLDQLIDRAPTMAIRELRDLIAEELLLRQSTEPAGNIALDVDRLQIHDPVRAARLKLTSRVLRSKSDAIGTIFYCTDTNYLLGTCVSLFSLLRNNMESIRNYELLIFCSDDARALASAVVTDIAEAFSVHVVVRSSEEMIEGNPDFNTSWGFFGPGRSLTAGAYYRIFAARQFLREGVTGRLLYLDADTVIGPGLDELLEFDLGGCPLGARYELEFATDEATITGLHRAAEKLGINPDTYFNSGVLLFDAAHPDLPATLLQTIDIVLHEQDKLSFLDQCALNLAFSSKSISLPERFNFCLKEDDNPQSAGEESVVWHFLDRPKPWDPTYASENCVRWLKECSLLRGVISADRMRRLLGTQFAREPGFAPLRVDSPQAMFLPANIETKDAEAHARR